MNVGTAKATVTGIGNYTGSLTVTFKIQKKDGQIIAGNKTVNQGSKAINVADRIVTDGKVIITHLLRELYRFPVINSFRKVREKQR